MQGKQNYKYVRIHYWIKITTLGCVTGYVYSLIFPKSSPVATNFWSFDFAQQFRSVPSMVSGHTPIVLKLNKQDCVAQSVSRRPEALTTWRQTAAFPSIAD